MSVLNLGNGGEKFPSVIADPFSLKHVTGINIFYRTQYGKNWRSGSVEFMNGKTKGEQRLEETPDFDALLSQIRAIGDSLK